ncbi:type VI secretion system-associated protein [Hahella sp. CCB-MM4]|uniref:type VI secretion system baseplate subunit TssK n=1 Tax=Hahella sp. (strain CCB-MM4) TaxID=1926491 RepID=UPI000B9AC129|nr:type VI secretion system baseplate subunit TssK [Hahella sp. CCB-MM4]OZG70979.1 type VI secretion system-associated protein [Hahella sp. CCB-MM4]
MSFENRVVWTEGMFLRPQHFQQQDRYHESLLEARVRPLSMFFWGFDELEIDTALLKLGKFAVNRCRCIFPDGTPVNIPDYEVNLDILEPGKGIQNQTLYLALPVKRQGATDTRLEANAQSLVRYDALEIETFDSTSEHSDSAKVQVGKHNLRLLLESEDRSGFTALPVARIVETRDDGEIILDSAFMPPLLDVRSHPKLSGVLNEVAGSLNLRAEALAGRIRDSGRQGTSEIADFMMLQMANRMEPWLLHLAQIRPMHPVTMFGELLQLAGELATFTSQQRRPPELPQYNHDSPEVCFNPLLQLLNQYMSTVSETSAVSLELVERKYGIYVSPIKDHSLTDKAMFVLAVKAHLKPDQIRSRFPSQVKIAPVEKIRDLVNAQLPGIGLQILPVAPRQIPYHAGFTYFQLDRGSDFWRELAKSSGFALHIGADFPGLEMEFWAIRD